MSSHDADEERSGIGARDLGQLCAAVDELLGLVKERLSGTVPEVRDWNDRLLVEAVARGARCLANVRRLACDGHSEDAYVLTRVLVTLTFQYLWLARVEDDAERKNRFERLQCKWIDDRVVLGDELIDLGYLPVDGTEEDVSEHVELFRQRAKELRDTGVNRLPGERDMALQLDRDLQPTVPRFFELAYARIYRPTSQVVHYGLGAAIRGGEASLGAPLYLEYTNEDDAAEALGLALATYALLLDFSEPVVKHGLTREAARLVKEAHALPEAEAGEENS